MKALVLTPGIKGAAAEKALAEGRESDLIYLTNPLYQFKSINGTQPSKIVLDDHLSKNDAGLNALIESGLELSQKWFTQGKFYSAITYQGICMGDIVSHSVAKCLVSVLRALYLYERLLETNKVDRAIFADDGSVWGRALEFVCKNRGVALTRLDLKKTRSAVVALNRSGDAASVLNKFLKSVNSLSIARLKKGGIIFSAAPKYVMPILRKSRFNYYLRSDFSEKAFFLGKISSFLHVTPDYFYSTKEVPAETPVDLEKIFQDMDLFFQQTPYFNYCGLNFWPLIRERMQDVVCREFMTIMRWIDSFSSLMKRLGPRAVVVEEEVYPFNKALVACANQEGIKTYCLLHSALIKKTVSIPSHSYKILAWGPSTKARLVEWGIPAQKITETGAPQFEYLQSVDIIKTHKRVLKDFSIPKDSYTVLLAVSHLLTNEWLIWKYPRVSMFQDILEKSLKITLDFISKHPRAYLFIKLHPTFQHPWFVEELVAKREESVRSRVRIIRKYPSADMIAASDLVLTMGSTVYFESVLLGRPSMVYDYADNRFLSFISDEFLDLNDPESARARLEETMRSGPAGCRPHPSDELRRHFNGSGLNVIGRILDEIGNSSQSL